MIAAGTKPAGVKTEKSSPTVVGVVRRSSSAKALRLCTGARSFPSGPVMATNKVLSLIGAGTAYSLASCL